ncbi:putative retrotransposon protein [Hordeum vulgare]|nr:putative retrotransposon protein [Hordeum vulgare]
MCINCGCVGHYRSECEASPWCPTTLAYLGYDSERGSFYFVDVEIEEVAARPHLATVTLEPEHPIPDGLVISSDLIRDELAAYIGDFRGSKFAWEVTETAPLVFSAPFPSAELLRVCSHGPIRCPLNQLLISVQAATSEPDPVPPLEKDDGPTRIEILCPAPAEIDVLSLVFYFGSKGRRLTFELESSASAVQLDPVLAGPEPTDRGLDEEGARRRRGLLLRGTMIRSGRRPSRLTVGASPPPRVLVSRGSQEAPRGGLLLALSGFPPSPTLGSPDPRRPVAVDPGWVPESPPVPRSRPREGTSPVMAARQSARISQSRTLQDGRVSTIPELAARRAAAHDLFPDSGIVFRGEKGPPLEQISALCAKERLEGALAEVRCLVARSNSPSPSAHAGPGHRETRAGGAPPAAVAVGPVPPIGGLPFVRKPRGRLPTRLNPTETRGEERVSGPRAPSSGPATSDVPSSRGRRGRPSKALPAPRGFDLPGWRRQLVEYLRQEEIDIVGLQETIRRDFSMLELQRLSRHQFSWQWLPASGHSGGILLGVREEAFSMEDMDRGEFFVSMAITDRRTHFSWEVIIFYGPADHARSAEFLAELKNKVDRCTTPVVVPGDFNLIRWASDKSSPNVIDPGCVFSMTALRTSRYVR